MSVEKQEGKKTSVRVHNLYIFLEESGECLFSYKFGSVEVDPLLVTGFLQAINSFAGELMPEKGGYLKSIDRGSFKIVIERGRMVVGALIADEETEEIRAKLKKIVALFERMYERELKNWGCILDVSVFRRFILHVMMEFPGQPINPRFVPKLLSDPVAVVRRLPVPGDVKMKFIRIMDLVNGKKSVEDIANIASMPLNDIVTLMLLGVKEGVIEFPHAKVEEWDVLVRVPGITPVLIKSMYGDVGMSIISRCDGTKSVREIAHLERIPISIVKFVLGLALRYGYVILTSGRKEGEQNEQCKRH